MNVFIPYADPFMVAETLDNKRRHKQTIECGWMMNLQNDRTQKHPACMMWRPHHEYLKAYKACLENYRLGDMISAKQAANSAFKFIPDFLCLESLLLQHRRRLYTKDTSYYAQFYSLGETFTNWYILIACDGHYILKKTENNVYLPDEDITELIQSRKDAWERVKANALAGTLNDKQALWWHYYIGNFPYRDDRGNIL